MRRVATTLALALCLLGCGSSQAEQVPLVTVEGVSGGGCILLYRVVDVIADPTFGTVIKGSGSPLRWPSGYTGWRVGSEVAVSDPTGRVVLRTGGRYEIGPAYNGTYSPPMNEWIVGCVDPCPDCELGSGVSRAPVPGTRDPL
jgi:hypothetical protein